MFNRVKTAFANAVQNVPTGKTDNKFSSKFPYSRPDFLHLNKDEIEASADHTIRPVVIPRDISKLPWNAGYAEVVNAGKSEWNEDQARAGRFSIHGVDINLNQPSSNLPDDGDHEASLNRTEPMKTISTKLTFTYFSVFDGHAGTGASLMAVNALHNFIQQRLQEVHDLLIAKELQNKTADGEKPEIIESLTLGYQFTPDAPDKEENISIVQLVTGALESAFIEMDRVIHQESAQYKISGGCTVLVALFFMGKLFIANAGDSRAVICKGSDVQQMSTDFTPETDRYRVQQVAKLKPELLQGLFTPLEFQRRISYRDVGSRLLYRDTLMTGWSYKTIQQEDFKVPLIFGEGKKARVLATIGVTRGFGDHDLCACDTTVPIKPFLSAHPEVTVYEMTSQTHTNNDVLILGTDGLWDVVPNRRAAMIVQQTLFQSTPEDPLRYTQAAQDLVQAARGSFRRGAWRTTDEKTASHDDITCFIIPLNRYEFSLNEVGIVVES